MKTAEKLASFWLLILGFMFMSMSASAMMGKDKYKVLSPYTDEEGAIVYTSPMYDIELANNANVRYGQYKIPCCKKCNSLMGKKIEEPVYDLIFKGYDAVEQYILHNGTWLFFKWLALIFFKPHLKDKFLNLYKDRRQKHDEKISDLYNWENLHHIHCIARSFYTGCKLDSKVHGSLLVFPATLENFEEFNFDYVNLYTFRTTLLRIGEVAFISVLNDFCAAVQLTHHWWRGITNSLSPIQLKEIVARLAITNLNIRKRPDFFSEINVYREHYLISAKLPERWRLKKYDKCRYGKVLYCLCENWKKRVKK